VKPRFVQWVVDLLTRSFDHRPSQKGNFAGCNMPQVRGATPAMLLRVPLLAVADEVIE
jgi:hypothetical protein